MTIPVPDRRRLRALRRMKLTAASLMVLAALVYVLCEVLTDGHGGWGYLRTAAEAAMVGGLADWFAVTALFRHPLGLPIPHTAIIPRKKDQIGSGLAGFVTTYFLTETVVQERVAAARLPQRVGQWLADPEHARQLAGELGGAVGGLAAVLRDDSDGADSADADLPRAVAAFVDRRLREFDAAPLLARLIDAACDSGQHQAVLTHALRATIRFLDENRGFFRRRLGDESPDWVPEWVDDRVFAKGFAALQSFLADVSMSDEHELRRTYETALRDLAQRLRTDPEQAAKVERAKQQLLDHPQVREWLGGLWGAARSSLVDALADPDSELRRAVESLVVRAGEALRDDPAVIAKADDALQRVTTHVVTHYAADVAGIISATVERWDTAETSRRLELQVGRDLQFIRINGTVVGALVGVIIHALTQLL